MKTCKNLFPLVIAFENLYIAAQKAARGKREKLSVMMFFAKLEENLCFDHNRFAVSNERLPSNMSCRRHLFQHKHRARNLTRSLRDDTVVLLAEPTPITGGQELNSTDTLRTQR
ncbi:MAG: hypothetical protein ACREOO_15670 [bacterium]